MLTNLASLLAPLFAPRGVDAEGAKTTGQPRAAGFGQLFEAVARRFGQDHELFAGKSIAPGRLEREEGPRSSLPGSAGDGAPLPLPFLPRSPIPVATLPDDAPTIPPDPAAGAAQSPDALALTETGRMAAPPVDGSPSPLPEDGVGTVPEAPPAQGVDPLPGDRIARPFVEEWRAGPRAHPARSRAASLFARAVDLLRRSDSATGVLERLAAAGRPAVRFDTGGGAPTIARPNIATLVAPAGADQPESANAGMNPGVSSIAADAKPRAGGGNATDPLPIDSGPATQRPTPSGWMQRLALLARTDRGEAAPQDGAASEFSKLLQRDSHPPVEPPRPTPPGFFERIARIRGVAPESRPSVPEKGTKADAVRPDTEPVVHRPRFWVARRGSSETRWGRPRGKARARSNDSDGTLRPAADTAIVRETLRTSPIARWARAFRPETNLPLPGSELPSSTDGAHRSGTARPMAHEAVEPFRLEDQRGNLAVEREAPERADRDDRSIAREWAGRPASRTATPVDRPTGTAASVDASAATVDRPALVKAAALPRHEALAQTILARARSLPADGSVEVRFILSPPELGAVRIRIEARGEQLRVELVAGTQAAADTLHSGLPRLTSHLNQAGFSQADVTLDLESSADPGVQTGQQRGENARASAGTPARQPTRETTDGSEPGTETAESGRLDRIA
jgi:hypothetical protein